MSMDGFSMSALAAELNQRLSGGRIDRVFQSDSQEISLLIRQPGETLRLIMSANPERATMYISQESLLNPPVPPAFCMLLRKHFEDGRISGVRQLGRDRVLIVEVDTRGQHGYIETKSLLAELMGKHSNVIFLQNDVIIDSLRRIGPSQSRYRHILPGKEYKPPPGGERLDPLYAAPADVTDSIKTKNGPLSKALIALFDGVGPVSAKEFVFRSGLASDIPVEELEEQQLLLLSKTVSELAQNLREGHYEPTVALSETGRLLGVAPFRLDHLAECLIERLPTVNAAVAFADQRKGLRQPQEKQTLVRLLAGEINKLEKKSGVLKNELEEATQADEYRQLADILMAHLYQVQTGSSEAVLPNIYETAQSLVTIALDPCKTPIQNANAYYQKYGKLKRAQQSLNLQLSQTFQELAYLEGLQVSLNNATELETINEIRLELASAGYLRLAGKKTGFKQPPSTPYMYKLAGGFTAFVGKNNRQNDNLTMKQAKADDLWFHTKDIPGSHVILRLEGQEPDAPVMQQAAQLAAYYSKARYSSQVPVDYTRRRYIKKPAGAKPGFVTYDHQSTLYVTPPTTEELTAVYEEK